MKRFLLVGAVAIGALFGVAAQAAPVTGPAAIEAAQGTVVQKVRGGHGSFGGGHGGYGHGYGGHGRWGHRYGDGHGHHYGRGDRFHYRWGYGWGGYGGDDWGGYDWCYWHPYRCY